VTNQDASVSTKARDNKIKPVMKPLKFANDIQSPLHTNGCYTTPLRNLTFLHRTSLLKHLADRNIPILSELSGTSTPVSEPRFNVTIFSRDIPANPSGKQSIQGHHLSIPAAEKCLMKLYEEVFCRGKKDGSEDHLKKMNDTLIPHRTSEQIRHIVRHNDSINIILTSRQSNSEDGHEINLPVAALSFSAVFKNEIDVSLAAVTSCLYDNKWGSGNDNIPFRRRGIMTFLLSLARTVYLSLPAGEVTHNLNDLYPLMVYASIFPNDPSRWLFFQALGFTFSFYSTKQKFHAFESDEDNKTVPFIGTEIVYVLKFGKYYAIILLARIQLHMYL
jgi:hypothetical protein